MKNALILVMLTVILAGLSTSCQKQYERPDITIGTRTDSSGGSGSGGGTSTGTLLAKVETKTTGSSEASTISYEYNASSKLTRITTVIVDSFNKSTTIVYRYVRDASGRVTKIVSNIFSAISPGAGFPDSVDIVVHYPSSTSANFDYVAYTVSLMGLPYSDSLVYTYANGVITEQQQYQAIGPQVATRVDKRQFVYSNGNVVTEKLFSPSGSATTLVATYVNEFDAKVQPLFTGNEGFLPGQNSGYASKNNLLKFTATDNSNNSVIVTVNYAFQYNSSNLPVSGTGTQTPGGKTSTVKFTYQ